MIIRQTSVLAGALLLALAISGPASAHATLEATNVTIGQSFKAVVRIGHGCEKSPTTQIRMQIPEGVVGVRPMLKPGWSIETVRGPYARSYDLPHAGKVSEGVKEIVWSGGRLPDDFYDEFTATMTVTPALAGETNLYLPVIQTCEKGEHRWTEIPAAGQSAHDLKSPAPAIRIAAGPAKATTDAPKVTIGNLVIEAPWTRATPPGAKVAGGYVRITNTGNEPDRLVGGTFPGAERVEVHEMSVTDGVMRMRQLTDGLVIKPGETVELKPGGLHMMFTGLRDAVRAGTPVKVELKFEKAGQVTVDFAVAAIGAAGPGGTDGGHGQHH